MEQNAGRGLATRRPLAPRGRAGGRILVKLPPVIKLIYKPFAIIAGFATKRISRTIFKTLWTQIEHDPPPVPGTGERSTAMVMGSQALQGAIMFGTAAAVNRTMARFFHHLIGAWPEKPAPDPDTAPDQDA